MNYWLVVTSDANFRYDRDTLSFKTQGLPYRYRKTVQKMTKGDKVVYYIMGLQRFGATATITGGYYEDKNKLWTDDDELWPSRCPSEPDLVLLDDELIDAKKLVPNLSFIERKEVWGVYLQGSIRQIPEEDFHLIESEMRKVISDRQIPPESIKKAKYQAKTEKEYEEAIMQLPLQSRSLHDRIGEMLEQVGSWLDYNTQTKYRITPDHAYELDVAWLRGKNPEIAIEIQISGNLTEAKDRLAQARKFNYRKVILVVGEQEMDRLNALMRHEHDLRCWMEAWSIGAIFEMYTAGQKFNSYYKRLTESVYKDKSSLQMIE
jgi:predicted RNA-binding protein